VRDRFVLSEGMCGGSSSCLTEKTVGLVEIDAKHRLSLKKVSGAVELVFRRNIHLQAPI
jgi:hypothetical protein